jgi:hypothetical protein
VFKATPRAAEAEEQTVMVLVVGDTLRGRRRRRFGRQLDAL